MTILSFKGTASRVVFSEEVRPNPHRTRDVTHMQIGMFFL